MRNLSNQSSKLRFVGIYKHTCKNCDNMETPHRINNISRARGVRLRCCYCNSKTRYLNINKLKGWQEPKSEEDNKEWNAQV